MKLIELEKYLNNLMQVEKFNDYGINGIQVECTGEVKKIVFGVTASLEFLKKAAAMGVDAVIVHHGLFWGPTPLKGHIYRRLKLLFEHNIGLIAYHLPLDSHSEFGNSVNLAHRFGGTNIEQFFPYRGGEIGVIAHVDKKVDLFLREYTRDFAPPLASFLHGNEKMGRTAIISGGGAGMFPKVLNHKIDTYLTGEFDGPSQYIAKEEQVNFIALGHEYSETTGIKSLAAHLSEKFDLDTEVLSFKFRG
ncbi:MAG: Nif3-like dinuclear metal center hexameric protein [Deltaproteobacteria bacterium]|jgi:dinuclear metal center YbgI/SA1388 family protein|nr:Nif3-like dinuclear metal center hexameric protein [Deltaproteobacteria bacterium]